MRGVRLPLLAPPLLSLPLLLVSTRPPLSLLLLAVLTLFRALHCANPLGLYRDRQRGLPRVNPALHRATPAGLDRDSQHAAVAAGADGHLRTEGGADTPFSNANTPSV